MERKNKIIAKLIKTYKKDKEFIKKQKHEYLFIRNKGFMEALEWVLEYSESELYIDLITKKGKQNEM